MKIPDKLEFGVGKDRYGRSTRLVGERENNGQFYWSIISDPVSQRDEGERIHSLTTGQILDMANQLDDFGKQ